MKKKILWIGIVLIVLAGVAAVALLRQPADRPLNPALKGDAARGAYLARLGDCMACHTVPGGKAFAGGLAMNSPVGAIYSTNITPDKQTGIGDYSLADFQRAVRQGIGKGGRPLYPAMPYPSFAKLSDQDVVDLYAYFTQKVQPLAQANQAGIPWPLNMRWPLLGWITLFTDDQAYQPDTAKGEAWNRGAYLVQGLGHCGSCHTPRGIGFQEKSLDQNGQHYLKGGDLDGWFAPTLNGMTPQVMVNWSQQDLVVFLKTGRSTHNAVFGPMTDVVKDSSQYFSDADLQAIGVYLASLNPGMKAQLPADTAAVVDPVTAALRRGDDSAKGAGLYLDNCAACHRTDGKGYARTFPRLAGNSAVNNEDPTTMIRVVLSGHAMPSLKTAPTNLTMPDYSWRLDNELMAQLLTFIRQSWGNQGGAVSAAEVGKVRQNWGQKPSEKKVVSQ